LPGGVLPPGPCCVPVFELAVSASQDEHDARKMAARSMIRTVMKGFLVISLSPELFSGFILAEFY
jgi:hypothetical protein